MSDSEHSANPPEPDDQPDLQDLLVEHLPALRGFVRLRVGPELRRLESESDFVQDVCIRLLRQRNNFEFRDEAAFRNWLYGGVLNEISQRGRYWRAARRDARRTDSPTESDPGMERLVGTYSTAFAPDRAAMRLEDVAKLEAAIDQLDGVAREILTLHKFVGLPYSEIAARVGKSEGACRQIQNRALAQLANLLAKE